MFNLPEKLRADLHSIEARIEEAIRQDERQKLLQRMAAEYKDRNGEQTSGAVQSIQQRRGFHSGSKLGKLYRCLASRTYAVTKNTLARESGMTSQSVYQGISTLRGKGYKIESVFGRGSKARYKLAS